MTAIVTRGSPPYLFRVTSAILQFRRAILTALCRDTPFPRPPCRGVPNLESTLYLNWTASIDEGRTFFFLVFFVLFLRLV